MPRRIVRGTGHGDAADASWIVRWTGHGDAADASWIVRGTGHGDVAASCLRGDPRRRHDRDVHPGGKFEGCYNGSSKVWPETRKRWEPVFAECNARLARTLGVSEAELWGEVD